MTATGGIEREICNSVEAIRAKLLTSKKFEYRLIHPDTMGDEVMKKKMEFKKPYGTKEFYNDLGAEGWELRGNHNNHLIFMREI